MAIGFGFSVSDICMALGVIKDSVAALDKKHGARAEFATLAVEIQSLQDGLERVGGVSETGSLTQKDSAALKRAMDACQVTIETFLKSIAKYQPHLEKTSSGFASKCRQIQWALCRKEDVSTFRAQMSRHAVSITLLLSTIQAQKSSKSDGREAGREVATGADKAQNEQLLGMLSTMSMEHRQCFIMIMRQNTELMQAVQDMRKCLTAEKTVAPQVLLQAPVILLDPFSRMLPFHLEFVDSADALLAVLKSRFSTAGTAEAGIKKLERGEFAIEHTRHQRPVDLTARWSRVWRPGEQYDMRIVFHRFVCPPGACPICRDVNEGELLDTFCQKCGLDYRHLSAIDNTSRDWESKLPVNADVQIEGDEIPYLVQHPNSEPRLQVFRPWTDSEDDMSDEWRRVQIISQSLSSLDRHFPTLLLIEDFARFAEIAKAARNDISDYQADIAELGHRATDFKCVNMAGVSPFASYVQIQRHRRTLTETSRGLRADIEILLRQLCQDPDTKHLMDDLQTREPGCKTEYVMG